MGGGLRAAPPPDSADETPKKGGFMRYVITADEVDGVVLDYLHQTVPRESLDGSRADREPGTPTGLGLPAGVSRFGRVPSSTRR